MEELPRTQEPIYCLISLSLIPPIHPLFIWSFPPKWPDGTTLTLAAAMPTKLKRTVVYEVQPVEREKDKTISMEYQH